MFKKVIFIALVICMLAVVITTASAATNTEPVRSIEEILNEYHTKASSEQSSKNRAVSNNSRSYNGNTPTLEQETVSQLTAAGYEAYNVTADNYNSLENELQTSFAGLGIDPKYSYVLVVSGEENPEDTSNGARVVQPPSYEDFDGGSGNTFVYTYMGKSYYMRYVTLTAASAPSLHVSSEYKLSKIPNIYNYITDLLDASLAVGADAVAKVPLSTFLALVCNWTSDDNLTIQSPGQINIYADTVWTRQYIQVWDTDRQVWCTAQCSSYATSKASCVGGYVYNADTNSSHFINGPEFSQTVYSYKYNNKEQRKVDAMTAYFLNSTNTDYVGSIGFYFVRDNNTILFSGNSPLFTHREDHSILYTLEEKD